MIVPQEQWYSGKNKCPTVKSQIIADTKTLLFYDVDESQGSVHDFKLCKESLLIQNRARAKPIVRNTSSRQRLFIAPKMCSIRQRTFDFTLFIAFCDSVNGLFR